MNEKAWVSQPLPRWPGRCIHFIPGLLIMWPAGRIRWPRFLVRSEERRVGKNVTGVQTCALPISYHLTNIVLHASTAIALFIFAFAFFRLYQVDERKSLGIAALASLAWALHPLHSGVVDYVAGRADSLAALFG